jgi:hypothetical protein
VVDFVRSVELLQPFYPQEVFVGGIPEFVY